MSSCAVTDTRRLGSDPSGETVEDYRRTRDVIKERVEDLIKIVRNNETLIITTVRYAEGISVQNMESIL